MITGYPAAAETYPIASSTASAAGAYTIKVYPTVSGLSITSANTTGTLNLNGAGNLTFDGRVNQTGSTADLIIANTNAGTSYAVQFINDAKNNTLQYCNVRSVNTSTTSGTIVFSTAATGTTGNDNNTITNCDITSGATNALNAIYSAGTSVAIDNSGNSITNNTISNYFGASTASNGIFVASNSSAWTITGNKFFQTATRTATTGTQNRAIQILTSSGGGYTVSNNTIGFANAAGTGVTTYAGAVTNRFVGIEITANTTAASSIQGNTISGFSITSSSGGSATGPVFGGIMVLGGSVNVGTTTGNTIGAASGTGAVTVTGSTTGFFVTGIYTATTSGGTSTIQNNVVSSITATGTTAAVAPTFAGVQATGSGIFTISSNTIGGSTANAIALGTSGTTTATLSAIGVQSASTGTPININSNTVDNVTNNSTGSSSLLYGIYYTGSTSAVTVNMNSNTVRNNSLKAGTFVGVYDNNGAFSSTTVVNVNNNTVNTNTATGTAAATTMYGVRGVTSTYTYSGNVIRDMSVSANASTFTSSLFGISNASSPVGEAVTNNQVYNLSIAGANTSTSNAITGIVANTSSSSTRSMSGNAIYSLSFANTSTGSATLIGLSSGAGGTVTVFKNKIYDLSAVGAASVVTGLAITSGTTVTAYNNLIGNLTSTTANLANAINGINISGGTTVNAYYNTVRIAGSSSGALFGSSAINASSTPTVNLRNNIFANASSTTGAGLAAAYRRSSTTLTTYASTSNNNLFSGSTIFTDGTNTDATIAAFKTRATPRDAASVSATPPFLSTTGSDATFLHVDTTVATQIESGGATIATFTDDYDGDTRNATTPDIGADEFTGTPAAVVVINSVAASPTGNACTASSRTITANITAGGNDITSVTLNYSFNGVAQTPITMTGGTLTAGTTSDFTGTIPAATSPTNANVTWNVTAVDPITTQVTTGTAYADEPLLGYTAAATASLSTVCSATPTVLTATLTKTGTTSLGTGASTSSTSGGSMFPGNWGGAKTQYIIKASELTAAGLSAGPITSLAFEATTAFSGYEGFALNIGHTSATVAALPLITSGLTQVYSGSGTNGAYATTVGVNTLTFSSSFTWNGTSNIVLSFCWAKNPTATSTTSTTVKVDSPGFTCTAYGQKDSTVAATMCPFSAAADFGTSGTGTSRPKFTFAGVVAAPITSVSWSDGTNTYSGNNASVSPTVDPTSYTGTITSSGCTINTNAVSVSVNPLPTAPTSSNSPSTQCGTLVPTVEVSDPNAFTTPTFKWYADNTTTTALQTSTSTTYTSTVASSRSFWVSVVNPTTGCESARTEVQVVVNTAPTITVSPGATGTVCQNGTISLGASSTGDYLYSWTANTPTGSGIATSLNGASVDVTPSGTGPYTYTVTGVGQNADLGCSNTNTIVVTITPAPVLSVATPAAICSGASTTLTALQSVIGAGFATIGTGTSLTSATAQPTAFCNRWPSYRMQTVYTAAELTAAGLTAGNITSMAYDITTLGDGATNSGFTVKIGSTTSSTLSGDFVSTTGFTTVYPSQTYTHTATGLQTINFSTPYSWNGTSNIIVEVIHNGADATNNSITYYTATTGNTVAYTSTASTNAASFSNQRLNVKFGGQAQTLAAGSLTYAWDTVPSTSLGATGNVLTVSPSTTTVYRASGYDSASACTGIKDVTVTVNPLPTAPTTSNSPSTQCGNGVPTVAVADPNGFTTPTFKWYTVSTNGTAVQSSTSTTYTSSISTSTTFYVSVVNPTTGCESARTMVQADVTAPFAIAPTASTNAICLSSTVDLSETAGNYPTYTWTASPAAGSGIATSLNGASQTITPTAAGTYVYTLTGSGNGCVNSSTVSVVVTAYPGVPTVNATPTTLCNDGISTLTAASAGSGNVTIGTQSTTEFGGGVYRNGFGTGDFRHQLIYTAAELQAAGITGGNLTSITFNVTSVGSGSANNYTIKLGAATSSTATTGFQSPTLTTVYTASTYTAVSGNNVHTFTTPYTWNGTSDLLVDICYNISSTGGSSTLAATTPSALRNTNLLGSSGACTATTGGTTYANRPLATFGVSNPCTTCVWSPSTDLYTDAAATTPYTGGGAAKVYSKPTATRTYVARAYAAANSACYNDSANLTVTQNGITIAAITGGATSACLTAPATIDFDNATEGVEWTSSNPAVATIDANGVVTVLTAGSTVIGARIVDTVLGCTSYAPNTVTLNVYSTVTVTSQPIAQSIVPGGDASFSIIASGSINTTGSYQWYSSADNVNFTALVNSTTEDPTPYTNVTTATLNITAATTALNGLYYRCTVAGYAPCTTSVDSDSAQLSVQLLSVSNPANQTACTNPGTATFTVTTTGPTPDAILWQVDSGSGFQEGVFIEESTVISGVSFTDVNTTSLGVVGLTTAQNTWKFRAVAVISDPETFVTSGQATITVFAAPAVTTQPTNQTACGTGSTVIFSTNGSNTTGYSWQYSANGTDWSAVANDTPANVTYANASTSALSVTTTSATVTTGTYYYRAVLNGVSPCLAVNSDPAQLLFNVPTIDTNPVAASVSGLIGSTATFTVATSVSSPTYQWQYSTNGTTGWTSVANNTPTGVLYTNATSASLGVAISGNTAASANNRFYRALVTSGGCPVTSTAAELTITNYCTSIPTSNDGLGITTAVVGTTSFTVPDVTFQDNTATTGLSFTQLATVPVSLTFATGFTYNSNIWIDFNDDLVFDSSELLKSAESLSTNPTTLDMTFTMPLGATIGTHRMRIGTADSGQATPNPCFSGSFGVTLDFAVTVTAAPTCSVVDAGTITASSTTACETGSVSLTAAGYTTAVTGTSFQWYQSLNGIDFTVVDGATESSYTSGFLTTTTYFKLRMNCATTESFDDSNVITFTVNHPTVTASNGASRCGTGTVDLTATGSAGTSLAWFTSPTGGTAIGTGSPFTTPTITATTDYYVEALIGAGSASGLGKDATAIPETTGASAERGIVFTATNTGTVVSAQYYSPTTNVTNTVTVRLVDHATGTQIGSNLVLSIVQGATAGWYTMDLNLPVTAGTTYRLLAGFSQSVNRIATGVNYASSTYNNMAPLGTITSGYDSGVSSTTYSYFHNISVSAGCSSARTMVTATVTAPPALTLSSSTASICAGQTSGLVTVTSPVPTTVYDTYTWSPATGVSGNAADGYTFNPSVSTAYTLTASQSSGDLCSTTTAFSVTVNPLPQAVTVTPANSTVCANSAAVLLTATQGTDVTVLSENFNTNAPTWTINGTSTNSASNFAYQTSPYTYSSTVYSTANGGKFAMANADTGGSGSTTTTTLTSPSFSLVGLPNASLTFEHYYRFWSSGDTTVKLEISTNGGSTWSQLVDYKGTTVGTSTAPAAATVSLNAYVGQSNVKIRYNYVSTWGYYWVIDNVKVASVPGTETVTWTSSEPNSFTNAAGTTTANTATGATTYVKTASSATYTATATTAAGCTNVGSTTLTVNPLPTASISGTATVCQGDAQPSVTFTGANGTAPYTFTYTLNGGSNQTITTTSGNSVSLSAPTTAAGAFTYALVSVTDSSSTACSQAQTGSAVITVNATTSSSQSVTACDSYLWSVNGTTYTTSGTYTFVGTNASGCTDTKTLVLTINNSTASTETVTSPTCGTYTWAVNGVTYTSSGTYTYTSTNASGCPDVKTLVLTINPCESVVTVTANIEGYYDASTHAMRPVLANQGVGSSSTNVDEITVELHDASTYDLVATATAMLQTNGTAVATYSSSPSGSFYVVVKHRNSMETWSANPVTVGATPATYNFTDAASKAYGNNMKMLESGVYGIFSGDVNQDGFIEIQDYAPLDTDSANGAEGYNVTDLNGDGFVEIQDYPFLDDNSASGVELLRP
ncbi:Ig-like domain-containing protein [Flavobacterium phycosphaerae]|uniref:Ig-like domain-containing protein n=1 Tax=Flavobacterium phycosphaerae TaxID=2697515 RepID=UPI0013899D43|nr:GEVED domain-containing protein [Flavobacterium phycosphaerae]